LSIEGVISPLRSPQPIAAAIAVCRGHDLKGDFAHAHAIRDDADFERRVDDIHFNPVKHGYVKTGLLPAGLGRRSERERVRKIARALCRGASACQAILHTLRSWLQITHNRE